MKAVPVAGLNQFPNRRLTLRNKVLQAAAKFMLGVLLGYLCLVTLAFIIFGIAEVAA